MAAQLRQTVEPAPPVVRWSARIAATGIAALALADCGGHECGEPSAIGPCGSPPQHETALGVVVADFNGDGQPDVAIPLSYGGNPPGAVGLYQHLSTSGKGYAARMDYPFGGDPYTILAFELNGDGWADLVTGDPRFATVGVLLNSAIDPATFDAVQSLPAIRATQVAAADMNGDGLPDIVIAARPLLLSLQNFSAPGTFASPTTLFSTASSEPFRSLALSDLNGDGTPDIAISDDDRVSVLFTTSSTDPPTIASTTVVYTNARPGEFSVVAVADIDGEGRDDLVIADAGGGSVVVLQQSGAVAGEFLPAATFDLPAGAGFSLVVADLNGDDRLDIVSGGAAIVAVLLQDAIRAGAFQEASNYGAPISASAVAVADIDGDGLPDIVTNSGITSTNDGGVLRTPPGVLYQDPNRPGSFLALQDLGAPCVEPPPGLVSWWPGDGNADDIRNGNDGVLLGGTFFTPAQVGKGFTFDSDDDGVTIPHNDGLNVNSAGFTVDFWMRGSKNQPDSLYLVVDKSHGFVDSTGWVFQGTSATGELFFGIGSEGIFFGVFSVVDVLDGHFHHIAGTWDGNLIRLYVDGVAQGGESLTTPANNSRAVNIGFASGGGSPQRFFRGIVDEPGIFNRALSSDEVLAIHNAGSAGKCR